MSRILFGILIFATLAGCNRDDRIARRIPVARAGNSTLYYDEIPVVMLKGISGADSTAFVSNFINKWAKKELMFQRAEANIAPELRNDIEKQLDETRMNLVVYEYQRQMMQQKMDTLISEDELVRYYTANENRFMLTSNIVKALFIKLPLETPNLYKIKTLARSEKPKDLQELESLCYQFAEKFDDFEEEWVTLDRLSLELKEDISNQENFLRRNKYYEVNDSSSVCLITINDYRLRGSLSPLEYVRDDIKRIIWNNRRIEFIQSLETGIYDEALKENSFKIY
jgi:hypothetical protein